MAHNPLTNPLAGMPTPGLERHETQASRRVPWSSVRVQDAKRPMSATARSLPFRVNGKITNAGTLATVTTRSGASSSKTSITR